MVALATKKKKKKKKKLRRVINSQMPPIPKGEYITLDVETDGLNPYTGDKIFCWSYATDIGEVGFMEDTPANRDWLRCVFADKTKKYVGHNMKFDMKMFLLNMGIDIYEVMDRTHCTLILSKLFNEQWFLYDLESLGKRILGRRTEDKTDVTDWLKKNKKSFTKEHGRVPNFSDAPIELVKKRAIWDTTTTMLIFMKLYPEIQKMCPELYETERQLMFVCIDMENQGVRVDITKAKELRAQAEKDSNKILKDLQSLVGDIVVEKKVKKVLTKVNVKAGDFNPGSPQHKIGAWNKVGMQLKYKTKPKKNKKTGLKTGGGNWAFDEYAMIRYVSRPLVEVIRESGEDGWPAERFYKEVHRVVQKNELHKRELLPPLIMVYNRLKKMISTYYNAIINNAINIEVSPSGREYGILHCKFNQSEAKTGRFSSSQPNFQNMPRILGPRECFVTRKGYRNWHLDYDQVEMKLFVHFAEDEEMAAAIEKDIHMYAASKMYQLPESEITKEQRKRGKGFNFGIIYGSGAATLAETMTKKGLPTTTAEATVLAANYHRAFPSVKRCTNKLKQQIIKYGFITNPFGRRYHIPLSAAYKALNYMCQGTSADIIKAAMVKLWKWLRKNNFRTKMIKTIHDEVVLQVPKSEEKSVIPTALKMMEDHVNYFIPITCSAEVNYKRWSEKKDATKSKSDGGLGLKWAVAA